MLVAIEALEGGISCRGQKHLYHKLNVQVQLVLGPKFLSSPAAKLK